MHRFLGFAAAALIAAAGSSAEAQTKLKFGYTASSEFASAFIAKEQGFFAKRGLDVEFTMIGINSNFPAALAGGSFDVGGPTPPILMQAIDAGIDLIVVAGGGVNFPESKVGVVARSDLDIKSAHDLVGKAVGAPGVGGTLDILFRRWLIERNVDPKKVKYVEIAMPAMSDALKSKTIDAALVPEPFSTRIIEAKTGRMVAPYVNEVGLGIATVFYASTREWVKSHPAEAKAFRDALAEGAAFSRQNPEATRAAIGAHIKLPPPVLATMTLPKLQAEVTDQQFAFWADVLAQQDLIKKKPIAAEIVWR